MNINHKEIGKNLSLYYINLDFQGQVFWDFKGFLIFKELKNYIFYILSPKKYLEIKTPLLINKNFLKNSGHLVQFSNNIFNIENYSCILKPLNCPNHIILFKKLQKTSRDLPIRYLEFGSCYRNESSGGLYGLMRLREFVQDDGHIFCTFSQILDESLNFHNLILDVYNDLGFNDIIIKLSLRPIERLGLNNLWDFAESKLRSVLYKSKSVWEEFINEGAFYGPKIEYHIKDKFNRLWQCGTLQLDIILPKLFDVNYIDQNNSIKSIAILHRAILGSFERFLGILLEQYSGKIPVWLSPIQIIILSINFINFNYLEYLTDYFRCKRLRVDLDCTENNINSKILKYNSLCIPYLVFIGQNEYNNKTISFRSRGNIVKKNINIENFSKIILRDLLLYI